MTTPELKQARLAVLDEHFRSEIEQDFGATLATFHDHGRYEIIPTGEVYDTDEDVRAYHVRTRTAFPDQRHENVRFHVAEDDTIVSEFDLLGTNLGEFFGMPPTGRSYRVPVIAVFEFAPGGDHIVCERVYFDSASLVTQIGRGAILSVLAELAEPAEAGA
jgi:steroid delta-isomerase-like uncharacterized protein